VLVWKIIQVVEDAKEELIQRRIAERSNTEFFCELEDIDELSERESSSRGLVRVGMMEIASVEEINVDAEETT
jgi:hypothetical protein